MIKTYIKMQIKWKNSVQKQAIKYIYSVTPPREP